MPTGYTANLNEGKEPSFETFVLRCSRAFIHFMREDPMDAKIPDKIPVSDYHKKAIAKAKLDIKKWAKVTLAQAEKLLEAEKIKEEAEEKRNKLKQKDIYFRYHAMMSKVEHWKAPKELEGLKKFMLEQLSESIKYDCGEVTKMPDAPEEPMTPQEFLDNKRESALSDLTYHTKEHAKEISVAKQNEAWIKALKKSVKGIK